MAAMKTKLLYLLSLIAILVFVYIIHQFSRSHGELLPSNMVQASANITRTRQSTTLLVYNAFFGNKEWITVNEDCSIPRTRAKPCKKDMFELTYDKRRFYESDFVLIHAASNLPSLGHLKRIWKQKPSWQLWIYFVMESPRSSPDTSLFNGMFDLNFSYRVDSDFWAPYGTYEETPLANLPQHDFSFGKDKLVSWTVSNCKPPIRKLFVRELQKYITVDVFGWCSGQFGESRSCQRGETCTSIIKQYKFFLAFENALCEDYITEKYWRHLGMLCRCCELKFRIPRSGP